MGSWLVIESMHKHLLNFSLDLQKQQNEFAHGEKQRILPNMTSEVELDSMVGSWKESKTQ